MQILKLSRKKCKVVDRTITNHTLKPIRLMKAVAMDTTSYVAIMTHIVNQTYWSERKYHLRIHGKDA